MLAFTINLTPGQFYVLVSRVTDPRNFELVGLPPYRSVQKNFESAVTAYPNVQHLTIIAFPMV